MVVEKGKEQAVLDVFEKWDLPCSEIGEVTTDGLLKFYMHGELEAELPAYELVLGGGAPQYTREYAEPAYFEKIKAFDLGANDFVTKPFGTGELLARIRAVLRDAIVAQAEVTEMDIGDLRIDLMKRIVTLREQRVKLSPKEFNLLKVLAMNAGKLLTHKYLMREVWGEAYTDDNQYLRIYIAQLRQKLEKDPARDQYIINEPGIGYRLEEPQTKEIF